MAGLDADRLFPLVDCANLATLGATGRLVENDAHEVAYRLAKEVYRL